jgi:hypothetical protein
LFQCIEAEETVSSYIYNQEEEMARKPSDPIVRDLIVQRMTEVGEEYNPTGRLVDLNVRHEKPGLVVRARDAQQLREALQLTSIKSTRFKSAVGSLTYNHGRLVRCHIDGKRHFKLLSA